MIGSTNRKYIETALEQIDDPSTIARYSSFYKNTGATDFWIVFNLAGIAKSLGSKKLYVDAVRLPIHLAGATDYLDRIICRAATYNSTLDLLDNATNKTAAELVEYTFTAVDVSAYNTLSVMMDINSTTANNFRFLPPEIRCHYA